MAAKGGRSATTMGCRNQKRRVRRQITIRRRTPLLTYTANTRPVKLPVSTRRIPKHTPSLEPTAPHRVR